MHKRSIKRGRVRVKSGTKRGRVKQKRHKQRDSKRQTRHKRETAGAEILQVHQGRKVLVGGPRQGCGGCWSTIQHKGQAVREGPGNLLHWLVHATTIIKKASGK